MIYKKLNLLIITALLSTNVLSDPIPKNPFLADSAWPIVHTNSYAQDSSPLKGPTSAETLKIDFTSLLNSKNRKHLLMDPIGLLYSEDGKFIWGASLTSIFRIDRSQNNFKMISQMDYSIPDIIENKHMHGAYSLLAKINSEEQFIVAKRNSISAYITDDTGQNIINTKNFLIKYIDKEDVIVGLSITYDGWFIYCTKKGKVGAIAGDFSIDIPPIQLPGDNKLDISNSFSLDETGGIYIVSNQFMQRVNWNPQTKQLSVAWNTPYSAGGDVPLPGRLGTGSGSTPSLMGNSKEGLYVVITDGAELMNLDVFDAITGKLLAEEPVNFGDPTITKSTSEQSVLINGWHAVVVNNQYKSARPILSGEAPMGIQQFVFDPKNKSLQPTWHINHISVPNGIPTMSQPTGMMYAIAKKQIANTDATSGWGLVGIDWSTGKEVFFKEAGFGLRYNSVYAATEVGLDGEIISGTALGVVRFK